MTLAMRLLTWKYCESCQAKDLDPEEIYAWPYAAVRRFYRKSAACGEESGFAVRNIRLRRSVTWHQMRRCAGMDASGEMVIWRGSSRFGDGQFG